MSMPPQNKENKRKRTRSDSILNEEEYRRKRDKNNLAVKRSRDKTKKKTKETLDRVIQLKSENETLEEKIKLLTKELSFLKDLFMAHTDEPVGCTMIQVNDSNENDSRPSISTEDFTPKKIKGWTRVEPQVRMDGLGHYPKKMDLKNPPRCHDRNCIRRTRYICGKCNEPVCPECMENFHK